MWKSLKMEKEKRREEAKNAFGIFTHNLEGENVGIGQDSLYSTENTDAALGTYQVEDGKQWLLLVNYPDEADYIHPLNPYCLSPSFIKHNDEAHWFLQSVAE